MLMNTLGHLQVTVIDGSTLTGLFAADGSINVFDATSVSGFVGLMHPCGAINCVGVDGNTLTGYQAPNGAYYVVNDSTQLGIRNACGAMNVTNFSSSAPEWVQLTASGQTPYFDFDFLNDRVYFDGSETTPVNSFLTITRSGTNATYVDSNYSLTTFAANTFRKGDLGLLIEPAATNVVLWNRDLTNVTWTKTNCTAAKDQTGLDGSANSASSLTSTSANGTCLQAITLASSARWLSAYIKRLVGTGTIEMTMDNGTTWTVVIAAAGWTRVEIPTQTLANPTVGFRIATSGDSIAIDYVQNEASAAQASSPIATTTASQTRNADVITVNNVGTFISPTEWTVMAIASNGTPQASVTNGFFQVDENPGNSLAFSRISNNSIAFLVRDTALVTQATGTHSTNFTNKYRQKSLMTLKLNDAAFLGIDGVIVPDTLLNMPIIGRMHVGSQTTSSYYNGYLHRLILWNTRVINADLQILAAAQNSLSILAEGDSITAGSTYWVSQLRTIAPLDWYTHSVAVSGSSINNATPAANINSTTRKNALNALWTRYTTANPTSPVLTVVFTGHNEVAIDGDSAATFLTELETYVGELKAFGHTVCVVGVTPSTTAGVAAFRATVNSAVATWVGAQIDYFVDWTGVPGMADGDASNASLWVDGIHPSTAQALVMAQAMKTQVFDVVAAG